MGITEVHDLPPIRPKKKRVGQEMILKRFALRLNTHEDFMGLHKITAALWLMSLLHITGVGIGHQFADIPESLRLSLWISTVTSGAQAISGYDMAMKYRANDPPMQRGMINLAYMALYIGPFAPDALNNFWIGNGLLILAFISNFIVDIDGMLHLRPMMRERRLRKFDEVDFGVVGDLASYGLFRLSAVGFNIMGLIMVANPSHDRAWLLQAFAGPTFIPEQFYALIMYNLSVGLGSFAVTLRDKQLIDKSAEQTLIAIFTLPAFFLTIHSFGMFP